MRITAIEAEPLLELPYLNAAHRGGTEVRHLRIERGTVEGLPTGLDALVATADLQGVIPDPATGEAGLLGVAVVDALHGLAVEGAVPPLDVTGALLAGDLFSVPSADRRGGFGDVRPVWEAFAQRFRWVAGVAGNHDDVRQVRSVRGAHVLDTMTVDLDGVRVGGVGLIAGDPAKKGRRHEAEQLERIALVLSERPDVLVLHEGPEGYSDGQPGNARISGVLVEAAPCLTVFGHEPWSRESSTASPLTLNVCERVVVLVRSVPG